MKNDIRIFIFGLFCCLLFAFFLKATAQEKVKKYEIRQDGHYFYVEKFEFVDNNQPCIIAQEYVFCGTFMIKKR